ncbi:hypothetical protein PSACC_02360 [Paramicrosporidium saccamoebae]|uniref:CLASP N-terminal domain-containing protein n=1 Tax=Paramicrosporidium saccamoebae TaxID=1246581 RepID=A0A2H9TJB9_9FUNG|nr:hypothetical protein PSACC_02360 [Paramicrosporidium saccamoebae]
MATIAAVVRSVGTEYEHLQEYFLGQILKLCERTSKILFERAKCLLLEVLSACPGPTKYVVPRLGESASSANKNLRHCIIEAIGAVLKHSKKDATIEHVDIISLVIRNGLQDAAEPVRVASRTVFADFRLVFPNHALQ